MNSNYYDEERMLNAINEAEKYDSAGFDNYHDDIFEFEGELDEEELDAIKIKYEVLEVEDFRGLEVNTYFSNITYLGWSPFFDRFIKIHLIIEDKFYTFSVVNYKFLPSNFEYLKNNYRTILYYLGIKHNSKGEEYPFLSIWFQHNPK